MSKITIEYLFPEVSNLYGDPFNVKYLEGCIKENGYEAELVKDVLNKEPFFVNNRPDIVYMGPMTEHAQELVISRLSDYIDRVNELINDEVVFFITGNAVEIFEKEICCEDGKIIKGLNIFPFTAKRQMFKRYNSLFLGEYENIKIVGNKSQFSHSYGDTSKQGFIKVTRGEGFCPGQPFEGIKEKNFFATYLLGPLLPLNPCLAKYFLNLLGIKDPKILYEDEAIRAYEIRLKEFEDETTELS